MIRLQFVLGSGLSSRAIAWYSAGHFSHVDYQFEDGRLLGARSDIIEVYSAPNEQLIPAGVQIRPAFYEHWKDRRVLAIPCSASERYDYEKFLLEQIGKPYDTTAIWGFAAGRDWRAPDSWFCSELQAAALEHAELVPRLYSPINKIVPSALALIASAIGAKDYTNV